MDSKMAKIERYGGHSSSRKGNYSHRKGDQRGDGPRTTNNSSYNNKGGTTWNWGKQQQQKGRQQGSCHTIKYVEFYSPVSGVSVVGGH